MTKAELHESLDSLPVMSGQERTAEQTPKTDSLTPATFVPQAHAVKMERPHTLEIAAIS